MLLGPPSTATGEPWALANNDSCDALEGVLLVGQEIKDTVSNRLNRPKRLIVAGILTTEFTARVLLLVS